jgi:RhoGAP domain
LTFIAPAGIRNRRLQLEALCHLVQLLPAANRDTLSTLLTFLNVVSQNAGDRKDVTGENHE